MCIHRPFRGCRAVRRPCPRLALSGMQARSALHGLQRGQLPQRPLRPPARLPCMQPPIKWTHHHPTERRRQRQQPARQPAECRVGAQGATAAATDAADIRRAVDRQHRDGSHLGVDAVQRRAASRRTRRERLVRGAKHGRQHPAAAAAAAAPAAVLAGADAGGAFAQLHRRDDLAAVPPPDDHGSAGSAMLHQQQPRVLVERHAHDLGAVGVRRVWHQRAHALERLQAVHRHLLYMHTHMPRPQMHAGPGGEWAGVVGRTRRDWHQPQAHILSDTNAAAVASGAVQIQRNNSKGPGCPGTAGPPCMSAARRLDCRTCCPEDSSDRSIHATYLRFFDNATPNTLRTRSWLTTNVACTWGTTTASTACT
eukprot:353414-Chlamydomonas_euryale.AAC.6